MRILALETSGRIGSIALLAGEAAAATPLLARDLPPGERSARSLLPAVRQALDRQGWRPADLELIAVATGPGSFTGLRIGVVAAKTLAYALGARLVGVHTLAAMAQGVAARRGRLWTVLDAQRQELFAAQFDLARAVADQAEPPTDILPLDAWLARLAPGDAVVGPPLAKLRDRIPPGVVIVDAKQQEPAATHVGRLAAILADRGATVDPLALVPHYFRQSAAEEKRATSAR
jgi:tRNA threonylcarbamoyladenosine biosynthesis protein TsaB